MGTVCLKNALIVDGSGGEPFRGYVLVEGDRIAKVGSGAAECSGYLTFDCDGLCILPGLIDCHVHLFMDGGRDPFSVLEKQTRDQRLLAGVSNALKNLDAGITTVRECGAPDGLDLILRASIEAGLIHGPRVVCAGRVITPTGGHGYQIGVEADSLTDLVRTVRREIKAGADFIKLMATGGFMSARTDPRIPQYDLEQMQTVVREAHRANRKVCAHAQATEGIRLAAEAGVDSIEHARFLDVDTAVLMKERGVCYVPTLTPSVLSAASQEETEVPAWVRAKQEYMKNRHVICFEAALEAGVSMAAGTDAGSMGTPHGLLSKEVEALNSFGLSAIDAIRCATGWAADLLGISSITGTLEQGKLADLVVVKGNPLTDLSTLAHPVMVMKEGTIHKNRFDPGRVQGERPY